MTIDRPAGWRRYSLWIFVALAYGITWVLWLPIQSYALRHGYVMPDPSTLPALVKNGFQDATHLLLSLTYVLISGPMVAAIIVVALETGRVGLRDLWQRSTHWRVGIRWYLIILGILCVVFLPAAVVGLLRGPVPTGAQVLAALVWIVPILIFEILASGTEEPGWRGYALPNLQTRHSARKSSLILGIIWGIWHWPIYIGVYNSVLSTPGASQAQAFITALIQLLIYIFGSMVAQAFIYTWLYNSTRSVFICILFHTLHNMAAIYAAMLLPSSAQILPVLGSVLEWIIAIVLMRFFWVEPARSQPAQAPVLEGASASGSLPARHPH